MPLLLDPVAVTVPVEVMLRAPVPMLLARMPELMPVALFAVSVRSVPVEAL